MPPLEEHRSLQGFTSTGEFLIYCQLMGGKDVQINTPNPRGARTGAWMALTEGIKKSAGAECPGIDESFNFATDSSPRWLLLERSQSLERDKKFPALKLNK